MSRQLFFILLLILISLCLSLQWEESTQYPDLPSPEVQEKHQEHMIDIGTHRLLIRLAGQGEPVVVIETGLCDQLDRYIDLQDHLARVTRVITYNRAGYGHSEPGPLPRDGEREADELMKLLENSGIPGPYLLVGHSLGAWNVLIFASHHPQETAGIVLLDPPPMDFALGRCYPELQETARLMTAEWQAMADSQAKSEDPGDRAKSSFFRMIASEHSQMTKTAERVEAIESLNGTPLCVMAAGRLNPAFGPVAGEFQKFWIDQSRILTGKSTRSRFILAENASHHLYRDAPDQVEECIVSMIETIRRK